MSVVPLLLLGSDRQKQLADTFRNRNERTQPNLLSTDGSVSRATSSFSDDGKWYAYALSRSGSDWSTVYVRSTDAPHDPDQPVGKDEGRLEHDVLRFVKFSGIGWLKDSKGARSAALFFWCKQLGERADLPPRTSATQASCTSASRSVPNTAPRRTTRPAQKPTRTRMPW